MGSAQLEILTENSTESPLKQAVAERLAQHRAKGTGRRPLAPPQPEPEHSLTPRAERARAAVAARYANSPSYRDVLAAEAERAVQEAEAAAEVAHRNARAIVHAQQQLLAELEHWTAPDPGPPAEQLALVDTAPLADAAPLPEIYFEPVPRQYTPADLRVQHHEQLAPPTAQRLAPSRQPSLQPTYQEIDEQLALDEEIEFRHAPEFPPHETIPANLIEFPRQLVASVKVRPRLAEGPLRDEADEDQMRIFEVESSQVSTTPTVELPQTEWTPLILETAARNPEPIVEPQPVFLPQVAPISLRVMASIVDACIVFAAVLACLAIAAIEMHPLPQKYLALGIPTGFLVLHVLYQLLFFTWSETTPGMRYARIGLCTFNDDNPTRSAMRRRILATVLSAAPLGIGFVWACLDEDGLGWHDRISRMYQRSY